MYLPDPRHYARVEAKNPLTRAVMAALTSHDQATREQHLATLRAELRQTLEAHDDEAIARSLALSPSQEAHQTLWQQLRDVIESRQPDSAQHTLVFALPVIMVAGAPGSVQVRMTLTDPAAVTKLLQEHQVLADSFDVALLPGLVDAETLHGLQPSQLYTWSAHWGVAARGLPVSLEATPIQVKNEGVFLRFLVGVASGREQAIDELVQFQGDAGAWGMPLSKMIATQLAPEGVTLFPIPRGPQPLLQALLSGRRARMEIGQQHWASGIIRKIRQTGAEPVAVISAHDNGELRFTLSAANDTELWAGFVWPLQALDQVGSIHRVSDELLRECQVQDIRVLFEVQPALRDDLPYFPTAADTIPQAPGDERGAAPTQHH